MDESDDESDEMTSVEHHGEVDPSDTVESELDQFLDAHAMPAADDPALVDYTTKSYVGIRLQNDVDSSQLLLEKYDNFDLKETKPVIAARRAAQIVHKRARKSLISAIEKHAARLKKKRVREEQPRSRAAHLKAAKANLSRNALKVLSTYTDGWGTVCGIEIAKALAHRPSTSSLEEVAKGALATCLRTELEKLGGNEGVAATA
jgi:hypothetical protein